MLITPDRENLFQVADALRREETLARCVAAAAVVAGRGNSHDLQLRAIMIAEMRHRYNVWLDGYLDGLEERKS